MLALCLLTLAYSATQITDLTDNLEYLPFIERTDGRTIEFTTEDFIGTFELFNMEQFYCGNVK